MLPREQWTRLAPYERLPTEASRGVSTSHPICLVRQHAILKSSSAFRHPLPPADTHSPYCTLPCHSIGHAAGNNRQLTLPSSDQPKATPRDPLRAPKPCLIAPFCQSRPTALTCSTHTTSDVSTPTQPAPPRLVQYPISDKPIRVAKRQRSEGPLVEFRKIGFRRSRGWLWSACIFVRSCCTIHWTANHYRGSARALGSTFGHCGSGSGHLGCEILG